MEFPKKKDIKRIMRYIQGTKSLGLFYSVTVDYKLVGYFDTDCCGDVDGRKSTSYYVFFYEKYNIHVVFKEASYNITINL